MSSTSRVRAEAESRLKTNLCSPGWCFIVQVRLCTTLLIPLLHQLHWNGCKLQNGFSTVQVRRSGFQNAAMERQRCAWSMNSSSPRTSRLDQCRRHHCLSTVYGCQPSVIELYGSPLLVPGGLCRAMSRPHRLCQFSIAAWRPTSSCVNSLTFVVLVEWLSHYWTLYKLNQSC